MMAVTNAQHIGTSKSARNDSLVDDEYYKGMLVCVCGWVLLVRGVSLMFAGVL